MKIVFSMLVTISMVVLSQSVPSPAFSYFFTSHPSPYYRFPVYHNSPAILPYPINPIWGYSYNIIPAHTHNTNPSSEPVNAPIMQPKVRSEVYSQDILPEVMLKQVPEEILPEKEEITIEDGIPSS